MPHIIPAIISLLQTCGAKLLNDGVINFIIGPPDCYTVWVTAVYGYVVTS